MIQNVKDFRNILRIQRANTEIPQQISKINSDVHNLCIFSLREEINQLIQKKKKQTHKTENT